VAYELQGGILTGLCAWLCSLSKTVITEV